MQSDYIKNIEGAERRIFETLTDVEVRAKEGEVPEIFGYGAVFNSDSRVMRTARGEKFIERIERGAFDHLLQDTGIVILFNHDANFPLARNKRSAKIGADDTGLWYAFNPPNSPMGQNIQESIRRGDVKTSSFSFKVSEENEKWEVRKGEPSIRTIKKFDVIYDLGPVTFEAYPETMVVTRNYSVFDKLENEYKKDLAEMDLVAMKLQLNSKTK